MMKKLSFSQRIGKKPIEIPLQLDQISEGQRMRLWNVYGVLAADLLDREESDFMMRGQSSYAADGFFGVAWQNFFKRNLTEIRRIRAGNVLQGFVQSWFLEAEWTELYEYLEFHMEYDDSQRQEMGAEFNSILESENSGYRVIDGVFVPITNAQEIKEIQEAVDQGSDAVQEHIKAAIRLLKSGDPAGRRKSASESVLALEALARALAGSRAKSATLPDAVQLLKKSGKFHPALLDGIEKIYAYASDASGMRHALKSKDDGDIPHEIAKFLLVASSAISNLLRSEIEK